MARRAPLPGTGRALAVEVLSSSPPLRIGQKWNSYARMLLPGSLTAKPTLWIALVLAMSLVGCTSLPKGQSSVDSVEVRGEDAISEADLKQLLATRPTPKFLGLVQGVFYDHKLYDHYVLQTDIQRVERIYRSRGYYHARVISTRVFFTKPNHARVVIQVEEGEPTLVSQLQIKGAEHLPEEEKLELEELVRAELAEDDVFSEESFEQAEEALLLGMRNMAYARSQVERDAQVDLVRHEARLKFQLKPAEKCVYGAVTLEGVGDSIPKTMVRRALVLEEGQAYSQSDLIEAQGAVLALGVFSSVQIIPQLKETKGSKVPIVVRVTDTPLQTFEVGAGAQLDVLRAAVYGRLGWRSQNLLGGLREFNVRAKPGVAFYPTRLQALAWPTDVLFLIETEAEIRQPQLVEARTDGVLSGGFEMYPLLLSPYVDENAPVLGYREFQGRFALERTFGVHGFVSPSYALTTAQPFAYRGDLDPDLRSLTISSVGIYGRFDTRDDVLFPSRGLAASASVEFAGGPFGGQATDIRLEPEIRSYVPLAPKWTLALRAGVGLLFPFDWGDSITEENGRPTPGTARAEWVRDTQISLFRSFFAGGPSSNRGYALRGIGPHGVIPFYVPSLQAPELAQACESDPESDPATCLLPLGGRTRWELSAEVRFPIWGNLHGATFCDAADVAPQILQFRFDRLHLSCGLGARYSTPVGPVRFDVGYRIPGLQTLGSDAGEGLPTDIFGLPIALSLSIGEAF